MKLSRGLHLAYCTNIHRGEDWPETFQNLQQHTLAVRDRVSPGKPYAIGLRLSDLASRQLQEGGALAAFKRWLDQQNCYIFTINGFPYGRFHGARVKEQVYRPDWTTRDRLEYTNRLFDILAEIAPQDSGGSVSTSPCSFKAFGVDAKGRGVMRENLWRCVEHIAELSARSGKDLHLGLEPEPLCYLETSSETADFIVEMAADRPGDRRLFDHLGVNYDTCHLAVEYETPGDAIARFRNAGVRISKLHLSSALQVVPTAPVRAALQAFADDTYLHQVIERRADGSLVRYLDLNEALAAPTIPARDTLEWRIHFHVPLHSKPTALFGNTASDLSAVLDRLAADPSLCTHLEMETYTWEVMPPEMKNRSVVAQLVSEYDWTLRELAARGFSVC